MKYFIGPMSKNIVDSVLEFNKVDDLSDVLMAGEIVDLPNGMVEVELISWDELG